MTFDEALPAVPTGNEFLDIIWSSMVPAADTFVAILPQAADPRWATEAGLRFLSVSLLKKRAAADELQRTRSHTPLRRVRARHLRLLDKQFEGQALAVLGAIAAQVRTWHPNASSAQLLMATRDAFRALQTAALPVDSVASGVTTTPAVVMRG